jgi:hypothetical protein
VAGKEHWPIFQKLVGRLLSKLFSPPLQAPISESSDWSGVNRRDFVLANFAESGFWYHMRQRYNADYIVVDAKNYKGFVKKRDILQVSHYLKPHGAGLFGLIFSRNGCDNSGVITAREQWLQYNKMVIVLNDENIEAMIRAKSAGGDPSIVLSGKIQEFRLAI